jgi:hypothetical protein
MFWVLADITSLRRLWTFVKNCNTLSQHALCDIKVSSASGKSVASLLISSAMVSSFQPLDVLGQNPRLNGLCTQLCLTFPLDTSDPTSTITIESFLHRGLERLAQNVPWVGGRVVKSPSGHRGIQISGIAPSLTVKLLETELPTYQSMRQADFHS